MASSEYRINSEPKVILTLEAYEARALKLILESKVKDEDCFLFKVREAIHCELANVLHKNEK